MITFSQLQSHARELIAAIPAVAENAAKTVLVDLGLAQDAEETALQAQGFVITIFPPLDADTADQAAGRAVLRAGLCVRVAVHPRPENQADIFALIAAVQTALLTHSSNNPNDRYRLAAKSVILDDSDPGLLAYLLFFEKATCL